MRSLLVIFLLISTQIFAEQPLVDLPQEAPLSNDLIVAPPPPKKPVVLISFSLLGKQGVQPVSVPLEIEMTLKNEGNAPLEAGNLSLGLKGAMLATDYSASLTLKPQEVKTTRLMLNAYKGVSEGMIAALVGLPDGTGFRAEFPLPFRDCTLRYANRLKELEITTRKPLLERLYSLRRADNSVTNLYHIAPPQEDKEATRIINLIRNNYGVDPALYSTSAIGDIAFRSIAEIKGYLLQGENMGICTGAPEITNFYQERNAQLTARLELYAKLKDRLFTNLKTQAPEFTASLVDFRDDAIRSNLFSQLREGKIAETARGYVSSLIWLSEGEKRLLALDKGFKDLFSQIIDAQKEECVCGN